MAGDLIVLTAFISPFQKDCDKVRSLVKKSEFIEVYVDTPLRGLQIKRSKRFAQKSKSKRVPDFRGISSAYEAPKNPEIHIKNDKITVEECIKKVVEYLKEYKYLGAQSSKFRT